MLNTKQKKKRRKKKSCSCQLCGRVISVKKTPPYHRASSPWAYMRIFKPLLWSLWTEDTDVLLQRTSSVFCSESIRCEPMPLFRPDVFFVVIQTTSKHWAQWSLYLPCSLSRDEAGVHFIVSATTLRHLARLFLSLLRLMWRVSTKQDLETKRGEHVGWCCGVSVLSLPVNLYNLFFPVCLSKNCYIFLMSMFVCVFDCFALTSAFICTVAVSCFCSVCFLIGRVPYNCYYYYCIVTSVSFFNCIFIWQLWRHVVHY